MKNSVSMHTEGAFGNGPYNPAVNVKVYRWPWSAEDVQTHFGCSEKTAQEAAEIAAESACEDFWRYWGEPARCEEYFPGESAEIFSEGRTNGWLAVHGLPDPTTWGEAMQAAWSRFETDVLEDVSYRISWEYAKEAIEANDWAVDYETTPCPCCGTMIKTARTMQSA